MLSFCLDILINNAGVMMCPFQRWGRCNGLLIHDWSSAFSFLLCFLSASLSFKSFFSFLFSCFLCLNGMVSLSVFVSLSLSLFVSVSSSFFLSLCLWYSSYFLLVSFSICPVFLWVSFFVFPCLSSQSFFRISFSQSFFQSICLLSSFIFH